MYGGTRSVPLKWMEVKKGTGEGKGKGDEETRVGKARRCWKRTRCEQMGVRGQGVGGGSMLGWSSPSSWDLPPTRPKNSLAHSLGRAGGRAGLAWPARQGALARGEPWKVHTHQWEPGGQQWRVRRDQGRRVVPRAACRPLPHLLGRLSVTRGGGGGPGGGRLLIGRLAEAGGAVQHPPGRQGGSRGGSPDPRAGSTPSPSSPPLPSHLSACPADDCGLACTQLLLDVQPAWSHSRTSVQSSVRTTHLLSATGTP